jgi:hypothetical protein
MAPALAKLLIVIAALLLGSAQARGIAGGASTGTEPSSRRPLNKKGLH